MLSVKTMKHRRNTMRMATRTMIITRRGSQSIMRERLWYIANRRDSKIEIGLGCEAEDAVSASRTMRLTERAMTVGTRRMMQSTIYVSVMVREADKEALICFKFRSSGNGGGG
jgi:hypothetical protein